MSRRRPHDIAIVGMGCRYPGAPNLFAFWSNILANRDSTREVPADRWPLETFFDPGSDANDRVACRRGGYLDSPVPFDAAAHGVMPLAVAGGEPEQFLILDAARAALDDAGIAVDSINRGRVEVAIGRGNYFNRGNLVRLQHGRIVAQTVGLLASLHPEWTDEDLEALRLGLKASLPPFEAATIPGQLTNATAGRVADRLDLSGASFVVDAASASSLLAVHLGSRALLERRADMAIAGGVYVEADVDFPLVFSRLDVLSRSGTARPFGADADGMIPGEGVGVVILKRLADAERDGDRIYAVLKGVGLASDGRGRGLTAPSSKGHARAMRRAYRAAGIDPSTVGLIEGHGLGVPAADRAELRALRRVFPASPDGARVLGAVSSQIGHAMPAAGMAGLIKAALALHHRLLPPTLGAERPDPRVVAGGFELLPATRPWIQADPASPRRAGVNAFGFAGINAHAVLEEHAASADGVTAGAMPDWDTEAFLLAADDRAGLVDRVEWLRDRLAAGRRHPLRDLAFTINGEAVASPGRARLGLVAGSHDQLAGHLEAIGARLRDPAARQVKDARGLYFWDQPLGRRGSLAFLFPGEGSQYRGMLADLCPHFPELRRVLDDTDRISRESGERVPTSRHLFGGPGSDEAALFSADTAVTAIFACQWAMFLVLSRLGLRPDAVAGHSSGEMPALAAAGVLRIEDSLHAPLSRLTAIFRDLEASDAIPAATLVAAGADRERVLAACRALGPNVSIAIDNCPHQVVLAGPRDEADRIVDRLRGEGVICEILPFSRAYHTPAFAAVLGPLVNFYGGLMLHAPRVPIYSCATAAPMGDSIDEIRRLAVEQWTRPVRFRDTVEAMYRDGLRVFVDTGARGNLCGYVEDILRGRPAFTVAANLPRRSGTAQLNHLVASLFAHGLPVDPAYLYARRRPRRIDLDAPAGSPGPIQGLELGFPEMKLPDDLAARLRRRPTPAAEVGARFSRELACASWEARETLDSSLQVGDGPARQNGEVHQDHEGNGHPVGLAHPPELLAFAGPATLRPPTAHAAAADDSEMLAYLDVMNDFLNVQREVMGAYLLGAGGGLAEVLPDLDVECEPTPGGPIPGPWIGTIQRWEPGRRIVSLLSLDGQDDPAATNHTLGGRRISAIDPGRLGLPVVPFSVMAEILAQAGALIVPPGLVLESLLDVRAHRWVGYGPGSMFEIRGECDPEDPRNARVTLHHFVDDPARSRVVFEGVARFAEASPAPVAASAYDPPGMRQSKFRGRQIYEEQWLFHGPAMQAVTEVGPVGDDGISGTIEVLPLAPILRQGEPGSLHTDPIVIDNFTHLLGCWGLDWLEDQGDVIFPLRMGRLSIYGTSPLPGTPVACRIRVRDLQRHRVRVDAEIVRPDESVWMRIEDWEDWRFHWPSRYRDAFRAPDAFLLGEALDLPGSSPGAAAAVWLAPPVDMARPVWRDVLEQVQLAPGELEVREAFAGSEIRRTHWLWGRAAAKEAARRLWLAAGEPPRFPADLEVLAADGGFGPPVLRDLADPDRADLPALSIAHTEGIVVALASRNPFARVGIDVEPIGDGLEREARQRTAVQAAAKAFGLNPGDKDGLVRVIAADEATGEFRVSVRGVGTIRVCTARRQDHLWAWTLGEEVDAS